MKKIVFFTLLLTCLSALAEEVPTMTIRTTNQEDIQIPIDSIQKITYDQDGLATMYVHTLNGIQNYQIAEVMQITLSNTPEPTGFNDIQAISATNDDHKIIINGMVYIVKDGKIYTMKGEQLQ